MGKLHGLISDFSSAMLIIMAGPTGPRAGPFTSWNLEKVRDTEADNMVQVNGQFGWTTGVIIAGCATVVGMTKIEFLASGDSILFDDLKATAIEL